MSTHITEYHGATSSGNSGLYLTEFGGENIEIAYRTGRGGMVVLDREVWVHGANGGGHRAELENVVPCWYNRADIRDRIHWTINNEGREL